ncbi:cation transporter [Candidatus Skiveiella danica]|uniref:cation transporter n=1 Tax=Candidatus Skiveiella danica TaxID=3386177 RepID=UPI0039B8571D
MPVRFMVFDIAGRTLVVGHAGDVKRVIERLVPLGYGAALMESQPLSADTVIPPTDAAAEARVLWLLLGINALMFLVEMVAGFWADSAALIADAADMLADAAVYGVALYAVGRDPGTSCGPHESPGYCSLFLLSAHCLKRGEGCLPEVPRTNWR